MDMPETLLSPSNILLYGRVLVDLQFTGIPPNKDPVEDAEPPAAQGGKAFPVPKPPPRLGDNNFFQKQLDADRGLDAKQVKLARIYGFSFEGHYYDMARPAIFVVHGPGSDPEAWRPAATLPEARFDRAPSDADRSGIARTATSFAEDIRVWSYDKGDFSIRLDPESGPFEQILLQAELRPDKQQTYYGGQSAFASGQSVFMSGQSVFLRGRGRNMGD
jgi:hypothetical protein